MKRGQHVQICNASVLFFKKKTELNDIIAVRFVNCLNNSVQGGVSGGHLTVPRPLKEAACKGQKRKSHGINRGYLFFSLLLLVLGFFGGVAICWRRWVVPGRVRLNGGMGEALEQQPRKRPKNRAARR